MKATTLIFSGAVLCCTILSAGAAGESARQARFKNPERISDDKKGTVMRQYIANLTQLLCVKLSAGSNVEVFNQPYGVRGFNDILSDVVSRLRTMPVFEGLIDSYSGKTEGGGIRYEFKRKAEVTGESAKVHVAYVDGQERGLVAYRSWNVDPGKGKNILFNYEDTIDLSLLFAAAAARHNVGTETPRTGYYF